MASIAANGQHSSTGSTANPKAKVHDPTQQEEGDAAQWVNEPLQERHPELLVHTDRPFNAEPPNRALQEMITPPGLHYRRQHTPVPVVDVESYRVSLAAEGSANEARKFSLSELKRDFRERELTVTFMCTGNRRSEFNTEADGETMGLPWKNGSISTAAWAGASLAEVLRAAGLDEGLEDEGYRFLTFYGLEGYHVSVPLRKCLAKDGDCILAWAMNGQTLPRDHGFPLRVVIPGYVGARSVKWISRIVAMKEEVDGMHQVGIAYKQLGPNIKTISQVTKNYIHELPPVDHVPVTSAITAPEPGSEAVPGDVLDVAGYAYSGAGHAVIRVDVSMDGGRTWGQAEIARAAPAQQGVRSGRAWAWVQWRYSSVVPMACSCPGQLEIVCKAVDDQYNQQPHDGSAIWNVRGILNTSWGRCGVHIVEPGPEAASGDDDIELKILGGSDCKQNAEPERAQQLGAKVRARL
jgi:sulfite oxidase